jgi:dTDP-4-amino-4,6-dideoxygalactose transaminase
LAFLGHGPGDFPETDRHARSVITFPVDQHLNLSGLEFVVSTVKSYYARNRGVGK